MLCQIEGVRAQLQRLREEYRSKMQPIEDRQAVLAQQGGELREKYEDLLAQLESKHCAVPNAAG